MRLQFRDYHTVMFLEQWLPLNQKESSKQALDKALYLYFKEHKAIGSKDRQEISQNIYRLVRWRHKIQALFNLSQEQEEPLGWQDYLLQSKDLDLKSMDSRLTPWQNVSMPQELYELFVESLGEDSAKQVALDSNEPAPVFLRVNRLKTTREALLNELPVEWGAEAGLLEDSIILSKRVALFQSSWFQQGQFEMQDLSSQLVSELVKPKPGEHVLDYCAGAGGKTLAVAPKLEGKGQIYLHDVRMWALEEARERLRRAGVQNFQLISHQSPQERKLKQKMDWVLVDAPCSGSGTLRRNPDMKEKIDRQQIKELTGLQRTIFERALSFAKDGGYVVYATCSLLKEENEDQVAHFLKTYPVLPVGDALSILPKPGLGDGFFGMVFKKRASTS